jgi:hypothetical protein
MQIQAQAETFAIRLASSVHQVPTHLLLKHQQVDFTDPAIANHEDWAEGDEGWNVKQLMKSMKKNGFSPKAPLTLFTDGRRGTIDDGHHRLAAAHQLGLPTVPVQFQEVGMGQGPELHPDLAKLVGTQHPGGIS